jgi:hypothetical protein
MIFIKKAMTNSMEKVLLLAVLLTTSLLTKAQTSDSTIHPPIDSIAVVNNATLTAIDTVPAQPGRNIYGELLDDDPVYNPRYAWWKPAVRVFAADVFNWAVARYVYKFDWASNGPEDWKNNLKRKAEFDHDGFGINFIGHPHTGNYYYNIARSNGYSYWGSLPFAIEGSVIWEYFGENTRPSYNDLINTPLSGAFLGEILYRLSSNVLDDRTTGAERVWREIFAGIINPPRALNRLTQGKMRRVTTKEVYQKEPLNMTFNGGVHRINNIDHFGTGATNVILNIQLDYGNPFEVRKRKPFDVFRFRTELSQGTGRKLLENVNGYGILFGRTIKPGRLLAGAFQHFDYWNNNVFEVGTLGFGGGLIARIPVAEHSNIYSTLHLAAVPLAGNNTQFGPDTSDFRHYNFGGGFQAKAEETFNLNDWASIGFQGFYYWIHTYDGIPGNSLVGLFKPSVNLKIFKNLSIGFEHLIYQNDRYLKGMQNLHLTRTEQKVYLQLYLEDPKRHGKYH